MNQMVMQLMQALGGSGAATPGINPGASGSTVGAAPGGLPELAALQQAMEQDQKQQDFMRQMAMMGGQGGTWANVLAAGLGGYMAKKAGKKAGKSSEAYAKALGTYQEDQARKQSEVERFAAEQKRRQELEDEQRKYQRDREMVAYENSFKQPKDNRTAQQRNFEYLQSLSPEQRQAAIESGAFKGGQTININSEQEQAKNAKTTASALVDTRNILSNISEVKGMISLASAGIVGQMTQWIGGSPSKNLQAAMEPIKSNLALDKLMSMKEASPTGSSGLGQVTEREFSALMYSRESLDQAQSPEQLLKAMEDIETHFTRIARFQELDALVAQGAMTQEQADVAAFELVSEDVKGPQQSQGADTNYLTNKYNLQSF